MSQANAYEQYILETINAERAKVGAQPLAFNGKLNVAAENHSTWMDTTDTLSHTGAGGSNPYDRMKDAGYVFSSSWYAYGENIASVSTSAPTGFADELGRIHSFFMGSAGHKSNILNSMFREIGVGFTVGRYNGYDSVFVTQDFAMTASNPFLTGVAFDDLDGDKRYDINEGLGGFTISAKNNTTGAITTTQTGSAGGYELELASGNYTVSFTSNSFSAYTQQVSIGSKNVKLDLIDPVSSSVVKPESTTTTTTTTTTTIEPQPTSTNQISGTSRANTLIGTSGDDTIYGLGGNDILYGGAGNDQINGGNGHDRLFGNEGQDILTGGAGNDIFVFNASFVKAIDTITDFSPRDDTIYLENAIFTNLAAGKLKANAFHVGAAAFDAADRIIHNPQTGALLYDADGSGGASAQQFAQLIAGLPLTSSDFYII